MNDPHCIASTLEKIKVMQAFCDGKQVIFKTRQDACSDIVEHPTWNWSAYDYTIAPTPKLRTWRAEEVPLGAWMRRIAKHDPIWVCTHRNQIC